MRWTLALVVALSRAATASAQPAALIALERAADLAADSPRSWYALGQAYNGVKQDAMRTFEEPSEDPSWRQLLAADAMLASGHLVNAFPLYRAILERMPGMVGIHDSIARIYEQSDHAAWAVRERAAGALPPEACAKRQALCEFRAGRYRQALIAAFAQQDAESRYWRARAANELALAAFKRLDALADSPERRSVRATVARAEERFTDAVAELKAALAFAPGNPALVYELASAQYQARDYEQAIATLAPLIKEHPDDPRLLTIAGYSLLQLRRLDEAVPTLRRVVERDAGGPGARLALGRALLQSGDFTGAIPFIEPQLADDDDGSLHVQLARAYAGVGQRDKAATLLVRSQEIRRAADERSAAAARRTITAPK
jgi:tetratricopeptide (TPR) repeat protein